MGERWANLIWANLENAGAHKALGHLKILALPFCISRNCLHKYKRLRILSSLQKFTYEHVQRIKRSTPPCSMNFADMPVPAPAPMIGFPDWTTARRRSSASAPSLGGSSYEVMELQFAEESCLRRDEHSSKFWFREETQIVSNSSNDPPTRFDSWILEQKTQKTPKKPQPNYTTNF